jgi:hypothetical protein
MCIVNYCSCPVLPLSRDVVIYSHKSDGVSISQVITTESTRRIALERSPLSTEIGDRARGMICGRSTMQYTQRCRPNTLNKVLDMVF